MVLSLLFNPEGACNGSYSTTIINISHFVEVLTISYCWYLRIHTEAYLYSAHDTSLHRSTSLYLFPIRKYHIFVSFLLFQAPPQYEFKYGVNDEHTHDIKEQAERRIGDKVEGYYKLLEADGTTRTVHYAADKHTGFNAQVVKSGHAAHPPPAPIQKVVAAPILSYTHSAPTLSYSSGLGAYH